MSQSGGKSNWVKRGFAIGSGVAILFVLYVFIIIPYMKNYEVVGKWKHLSKANNSKIILYFHSDQTYEYFIYKDYSSKIVDQWIFGSWERKGTMLKMKTVDSEELLVKFTQDKIKVMTNKKPFLFTRQEE